MADNPLIRDFLMPEVDLNNRSILITGGTGSFGRYFVKAILEQWTPARLIIFSRDELKQSEMAHDFPPEKYPSMRYFIGDVRDANRLEMAMRDVDYVIHAAALKQVPAAEYNPFECIHTNVLGAENVVQAAIRNNVKKVLALSTDKAASPANLYGASKLASDKIFVAANNLSGINAPDFSVVRYGNVLGSRGSVAPLFLRLISENDDPLPVTDARMTRFTITLQQSVNFVLSSLSMMRGGEIFIPKIPSVKVTDLADTMAPGRGYHIIGIRPGEKLHEMMITVDDARNTVEAKDRFIILPAFPYWAPGEYTYADTNPVAEDFSYTSDTNTEWLVGDELEDVLLGEGMFPASAD